MNAPASLVRAYPNWLKAYVANMRNSEAPIHFHFWTGVATIAGALARRVWIDEEHWKWYPNFYIILVAPPGIATKSTSMNAGMELLETVPSVFFGPVSMTWQALLDSFKDAQTAITPPGFKNPVLSSALTIAAPEIGTFLKPEDRELLDFLITTWDGNKLSRRTVKGGETSIPNSLLNFIGCTTPSWLKDRMPGILIDGGLSSRVLFVYAAEKAQLIAYPSRRQRETSYEDEKKMLSHDLNVISKMSGPFKLSEDTYNWGEQWYHDLWNGKRPAHLSNDRFQGYISRKQNHIHKLAMILAASKRNALTIELEDVVEAEAQITALEHSMLQVFNSIGVRSEARLMHEVLATIKNAPGGTTTYKALFQVCSATMGGRDFREAVKSAIEAGVVKQERDKADWKLTYVGAKDEKTREA